MIISKIKVLSKGSELVQSIYKVDEIVRDISNDLVKPVMNTEGIAESFYEIGIKLTALKNASDELMTKYDQFMKNNGSEVEEEDQEWIYALETALGQLIYLYSRRQIGSLRQSILKIMTTMRDVSGCLYRDKVA